MTGEERAILIEEAKLRALTLVEDGQLGEAVAAFHGALNRKIDPPIHHADITQGVLMAQNGDRDAVVHWLEKF